LKKKQPRKKTKSNNKKMPLRISPFLFLSLFL